MHRPGWSRGQAALRVGAAALALALAMGSLPVVAADTTAPVAAGAGGNAAFTDVANNWAAADIDTLLEDGVLTVPADGTFRPDDDVTRADFALWMSRALELPDATGAPAFSDLGGLSADAVAGIGAAVQAGLLQGFPNGTFQPTAPITRAQIATILGRELEAKGEVPEARYKAIFADGDQLPDWALPTTIIMKDQLIYGKPCKPAPCFAPFDLTTRAEATAFIVRFMEYLTTHYHQAPLPPATLPQGFVTGMWYSNTDEAYANLQAYGSTINELIYGGYNVQAGGVLAGYDSPRVLAWAQAHPTVPLWVMVQGGSLSFLTSAQDGAALISSLVAVVQRAGYAGVNFDIEGIPGSDRAAYSQFIATAAAALAAVGAKISVAVPSETASNLGESFDAAYDYVALGASVDQLITMTYDYHYAGGRPGPVAPISWAKDVMAYASSAMPPSKVVLGMPVYGYVWKTSNDSGTAYWESGMYNMASEHGATITRDAAADEATFSYTSNGQHYVGWFVDGQGAADRLALAHASGIGGVMGWRMDYDAPDWWPAFAKALATWR